MDIVKITPKGIHYVNNSGEHFFLDFRQCNENWLAYRRRTETLNEEQAANLRGKDNTVGQRDVNSNYAFIEFFTQPFTKFEFDMPKETKSYGSLRDSVMEYGWSTIDWS